MTEKTEFLLTGLEPRGCPVPGACSCPIDDIRDAKRYRWLRKRDLETIDAGGLFVGKTPANVVLNGKDLDQEIDEAMNVQ